ncbi:hypothetical protein [Cellulomonas alba]|uniref:Uncharacterized protein n=1 Tax=Cellulomonas alba TaxID=3053467 RepID=A0ABT7SBA3_9CELL|nr:hypothetical protein [Cellulomonas alba]MDM7853466.1 hypothetical protein [Cellulomonas alba]
MIDLAAPARTYDGVTVMGDHADATRFHYVPVRPRLVTDDAGRPELTLLKYQLDEQTQGASGAGVLSLAVDLDVADDVLAAVRAKVAAAVGRSGITLTPVWPDSGTCRLIILGSDGSPAGSAGGPAAAAPAAAPAPGGLVETVVGGADPALASGARTLFTVSLTPDGVALVEQALTTGGLPFGVVYDLRAAALRPALHATVTADYAYAYHYYENRFHGGRLLVAADIGETIQDLRQQQAITVTIDDLVPDADRDAVYQQAIDAVTQYVLQTLFTPTLSQAPAPPSGGNLLSTIVDLFTASYSLITLDTSELKTLTYTLTAATAEEIPLAPQGELVSMLPAGTPAAQHVVTVTAPPADHLVADVATLVDLAAESIERVDVTLTFAGADSDVTLMPAAPHVTTSLWRGSSTDTEAAYRYRVQFAADGTQGLTGALAGAGGRSAHGLVRVDPRELYQRLEVRPALHGVPSDRFPRVLVDLSAHEALDGWSASTTLSLDATTTEALATYRARKDGLVDVQARVRYVRADGTELVRAVGDVEPGPFVIGDPEPDQVAVSVLASARFGTAVARLVVELRPDAAPDRVTTLTLDSTTTAAPWSYAPSAAARGYAYRVTVQEASGAVRTGEWLPGPDSPTLVVGEGFAQLRDVRIQFVGTTLAAAGLLALRIRCAFTDPTAGLEADQEFLAQDPLAPLTWQYPVADAARADYAFTITRIHADGSATTDATLTGPDLLRVVPVVAP